MMSNRSIADAVTESLFRRVLHGDPLSTLERWELAGIVLHLTYSRDFKHEGTKADQFDLLRDRFLAATGLPPVEGALRVELGDRAYWELVA